MVDIKMLHPGMKVKVIDQWPTDPGFGYNRYMCEYLGQVVTIHEVGAISVTIEEDEGVCCCLEDGRFHWGACFFDCIVAD